jgi:protoheme IX farnesyltransferase
MTSFNGFRDLLSLFKVRLVLLVTFCSSISFIIGGGIFNSERFWFLTFSTFLTASGTCVLHNYLDNDLDQLMERTKNRPIPANRISLPKVFTLGTVTIAGGLGLALYLNLLTFAFGLGASLVYLIVYTKMMKKRTPLNILLGSPAGGLPVLAGWAAVRGEISFLAVLLSAIVVLWIPNHIWSLAALHVNDYKRAKVPMLPAVVNLKKTFRCTTSTVSLLFLITTYLFLGGFFGKFYLALTLPFGIFLLAGNIWVSIRPTISGLYKMFKFSSPYLAVIFISMVIDLNLR